MPSSSSVDDVTIILSRVDAKDLWAFLVNEGLYNDYDGFKEVMDILEKAWTGA